MTAARRDGEGRAPRERRIKDGYHWTRMHVGWIRNAPVRASTCEILPVSGYREAAGEHSVGEGQHQGMA